MLSKEDEAQMFHVLKQIVEALGKTGRQSVILQNVLLAKRIITMEELEKAIKHFGTLIDDQRGEGWEGLMGRCIDPVNNGTDTVTYIYYTQTFVWSGGRAVFTLARHTATLNIPQYHTKCLDG